MNDEWGPRGSHRSDSGRRVQSCGSRSGSQRVLVGVFTLVLSILLTAPAHAQARVDVGLEVGFDNRYAPGQWTPVSAVVDSPQAISGTLEITHDQPDGSDSLFTMDIEVAGGGRKEFHLVIPGPPGQRRVNAQVVSDDEVIGSATATPLVLQETALIGVLGDASQVDPFTAEPSLTEMIPVPVTTGHLNLGAPALSALSYVIASSDDLDGLVPEQRDALDDWIATGGRMVVLAEDPAAVRWPDAAQGLAWSGGRASDADISLAGDRIGVVRSGLGEVMVTRGRLSSIHRDVIETALRPPPAVYSAGSQEFFNDFGPGTSADVELMNRVRARGGNLRLSWFVGFLVVYLVLVGPINYFVLKRRGTKELLWVTVPVLALLFSGVAYGLARGSRGGTQAATAGVVFATESGQEGRAVAIVSSGTGGDRTFGFPTKAAVAPTFLPFFGSSQNGSTRLTPEGAAVTVQTAPFGMHFARGTLDRFDGFIEAQVQPKGTDLRYEVMNRTPYELSDVNLVFNSQAIEVDDLEPGGSITGRFDDVRARRGRFRLLGGGLRNALLSEIRAMLGPTYFSAPLVVGMLDDYDLGIRLDGRPAGEGRFMVAAPVATLPATGDPTPAGSVDVVSTDGHMTQYGPGTLTLEGFQEAVFGYRPAAGSGGGSITGGTVTFQAGGSRQEIERYDWSSERWVSMGRAGRGRLVEELPAETFSSSGEAYFRLRANRHGYTEILRFEVEPVIG